VSAGATDYVLRPQEGISALVARVRRLVARSRRHRLYLHLVGTLYHAAKRANPELADDLVLAQVEDDAAYIRNVRPTADNDLEMPDTFSIPVDFMEGPDTSVILVTDEDLDQAKAELDRRKQDR
jgi:hypothetical protein